MVVFATIIFLIILETMVILKFAVMFLELMIFQNGTNMIMSALYSSVQLEGLLPEK